MFPFWFNITSQYCKVYTICTACFLSGSILHHSTVQNLCCMFPLWFNITSKYGTVYTLHVSSLVQYYIIVLYSLHNLYCMFPLWFNFTSQYCTVYTICTACFLSGSILHHSTIQFTQFVLHVSSLVQYHIIVLYSLHNLYCMFPLWFNITLKDCTVYNLYCMFPLWFNITSYYCTVYTICSACFLSGSILHQMTVQCTICTAWFLSGSILHHITVQCTKFVLHGSSLVQSGKSYLGQIFFKNDLIRVVLRYNRINTILENSKC